MQLAKATKDYPQLHYALENAPVAQLDRVRPSEGRGHRFESCRARHPISSPQAKIHLL